tara:strand:+ start:432 stop:1034 length:603 start_codon:yes stop_codon:yes gene_type:complete
MKEKKQYQSLRKEMTKEGNWRKMPYNVILDKNVSSSMLSIYAALVKECPYRVAKDSDTQKSRYKITRETIEALTGITNTSAAIKKLKKLGYITEQKTKGLESKYQIIEQKGAYSPLRLEDFDLLRKDRARFNLTLENLALSNGNDELPSYKESSEKFGVNAISRAKYRNLVKVRAGRTDVELHELFNYSYYVAKFNEENE